VAILERAVSRGVEMLLEEAAAVDDAVDGAVVLEGGVTVDPMEALPGAEVAVVVDCDVISDAEGAVGLPMQ